MRQGIEDPFVAKVVADAFSPEPDPELRTPENVDRWRETLGIMTLDIQGQLAERALDDVVYDDEYRDWRRRALGFKRAIDRRLLESKGVQKRANVSRRESAIELKYRMLRRAVAAHRDELGGEPIDSADQKLWDALEEADAL